MKFDRFAGWAGRLALLAGLLVVGGVQAQAISAGPAEPAGPCVAPCLYDQTDNAGIYVVDSSNYGSNEPLYTSQAADDFVVPNNVIWHITTVTVLGEIDGSHGAGVFELQVQFFGDSGSELPGAQQFNQVVPSGSLSGLTTGDLVAPLSPPAVLFPGHYWLSAQAHEQCAAHDANCKLWYWTERTVQSSFESAYQDPPGFWAPNCKTWQPRVATCQRPGTSSGPDLLFKLDGSTSPIVAQVLLPVVRR